MNRIAMLLAVVAIVMAAVADAPAPARAEDRFDITVLSNRADLISGGDALIEIVLPAGVDPARVRVDVDGRDVTAAFGVRPNRRYIGLVTGLAERANVLTARAPDGSGASITITNHPIGGPVFAGFQVQPWICNTVANGFGPPLDAQCNVPTKYEFFYRATSGSSLQGYDPNHPASDVSMTTTDQGRTVPFIVRRETGVIDRGWYSIAVLFDPTQPWVAWAPQAGWNGKISWSFGGSSTSDHYQRNPPSVLNTERLGAGFMVAAGSLNTHGQNNNDVVSSETVMMIKERIIEQYGQVRYVIGDGCSGGAILQHMLANAYPGLIDGIQPSCSFPDSRTTGLESVDCSLLLRYFRNTSPQLWLVEAQRGAVSGHPSESTCIAWVDVFAFDQTANPSNGCGGSPNEPWVYHADTNPEGERCTSVDYAIAVWGRRDPDLQGSIERQIGRGFGRNPYSNEGVQYGRHALMSGEILPEQFVDLNAKIGGRDIDYNWIPQRTSGDRTGSSIAYGTGRVNDAVRLDRVPIIDLRGHDNEEIHTDINSYIMRQRLLEANGHTDNHVMFIAQTPLVLPPSVTAEAFSLMDQWLANIEADTSNDPREVKVVRNKPAGAVDSCYIGTEKVTDQSKCRPLFPYFGTTRIAAGGPLANDVMRCELTPLNRLDYLPVTFTDEQWARLQAAFPTGVCDFNRPPVNGQLSAEWVTFMDGLGIGRPLGPPPVATAIAPLPDLTVTSVSLSSSKLTGGDPLTFTAVITNAAAGVASNVAVRFLVDGAPLGAEQSIAQLAGGASRTLTAQWSAKDQNGTHTVEVAVDPANTIPELDETNNRATKTFAVQGGKVQ